MSIVKFNAIEDYWSQSFFSGHADFKRVMSRYDFTNIRSSLTFEPQYSHAVAVRDPLWHSRKIMMNFLQNCAATAVSVGVLSFDENTIRCKARTGARSYIKSKPVKYGIRLYAMCGWRYTYLCNFWDNNSGNLTGVSPAKQYVQEFRDLRGPYQKTMDKLLIDKDKPSALWVMQMAHLTKQFKDLSGKGLLSWTTFILTICLHGRQQKQVTMTFVFWEQLGYPTSMLATSEP